MTPPNFLRNAPAGLAGTLVQPVDAAPYLIAGDSARALAGLEQAPRVLRHCIHCSAACVDGWQSVAGHGPVVALISLNGRMAGELRELLESRGDLRIAWGLIGFGVGFWPGEGGEYETEASVALPIHSADVQELHELLFANWPDFGGFAVASFVDGTNGFDATGYGWRVRQARLALALAPVTVPDSYPAGGEGRVAS